MTQLLTNARIFTGDEILQGWGLRLADGLVQELLAPGASAGDTAMTDLGGDLLAPGFIDCQVNGGGGILFTDQPDVATISAIATAHRKFGTTGLLPTLISTDWESMTAAAAAVQTARKQGLAGLLGLHFEGPYLNPERKGAHDGAQIRPLDNTALDLFASADLGSVVVTLAPEMVPPGTIRRLADAGVRICAGHSAASHDQITAALDEGLAGFTHLFNAMPAMASRQPGIVGAALADRNSYCGIIADGHHVHPTTLRVALAAKTAGRMLLVTDAMPSVGGSGDSFQLAGRTVNVSDGRCTLADGTLAGSNLDMATAVRNTVNLLEQTLEEALRMASLYPAEFLGLAHERGRIAPGYRADLVQLDDDLNVRRTWIGGE
ncbi:MAG: N-acetylglucosamine-6-phosphate deacetylase [Rhodospirillaceae bacterium]|jgi:N-acetylglucosamine-6-phosphate deacetylase|nr:N-acetylglucosamine-6-phosphate deacetylase [Rhodospirillaceae bacterium]MBT3491699.1 N-acetylglucosamine-6-phosphate deacetylase [Rhodospirillaceae bacterium]MBT3783245.1 N-acetylglucosamine-6-phosphate deacetylase [Rhodospirillaceae bacterium]MBT3978241.1 N-acetylglucosamine-6-phosphate deacetylase [Rhodospirillaceae bacterium]MBT4168946.1 N-acetylglucosamine-6-phosphate deacetylase [Rhodospirillaceae bacterium]